MVSGKGRRERGMVRLQIGQIRPEAGAHYLYELLPEADYCAYYLAWHYHQSSDCVWLKLSFFRCHRISHRLRSLVISVCAHIASSVQSSAIVPFGIRALSLSKGKTWKRERKNSDCCYLKFLLTFVELICVNCCFAGQSLNKIYRCCFKNLFSWLPSSTGHVSALDHPTLAVNTNSLIKY